MRSKACFEKWSPNEQFHEIHTKLFTWHQIYTYHDTQKNGKKMCTTLQVLSTNEVSSNWSWQEVTSFIFKMADVFSTGYRDGNYLEPAHWNSYNTTISSYWAVQLAYDAEMNIKFLLMNSVWMEPKRKLPRNPSLVGPIINRITKNTAKIRQFLIHPLKYYDLLSIPDPKTNASNSIIGVPSALALQRESCHFPKIWNIPRLAVSPMTCSVSPPRQYSTKWMITTQ